MIAKFSKEMSKNGYKEINKNFLKGGFIFDISKNKPVFWVTNGKVILGVENKPSGFVVSKETNAGAYDCLVKVVKDLYELSKKSSLTLSIEKNKEIQRLEDSIGLADESKEFVIKIGKYYYLFEFINLILQSFPTNVLTYTQNQENGFLGFFYEGFYAALVPYSLKDESQILYKV